MSQVKRHTKIVRTGDGDPQHHSAPATGRAGLATEK